MTTVELCLKNSAGLHARPAAQFVQKAACFVSKVTLEAGGRVADGKSILSVMMLGLGQHAKFILMADGSDEDQCVLALKMLVENNFGEG